MNPLENADGQSLKEVHLEIELNLQTADPLHIQIQRRIEAMIRSGELDAGERLPPTNALIKKWGVHPVALQKAMSALAAAGLIERKSGRGTFVRPSTDK